MNNEFLPKELCVILKEIGFNEKCFAFYVNEHDNVKMFSDPWNGELRNEDNYFIERDNWIAWSCTAPTINQVFRWFEKEHGMYVEWLIDMWGDNYKVSGDWICYTTFIWEVGKSKPKPHDEVGHGSWNAMAQLSIYEMITKLKNRKDGNKYESLDELIHSNEQERRLIQMMQDDENDGLYENPTTEQ